MPTLAELLLQLIADQPLSKDEKREVAMHVLRLVRRIREARDPSGVSGRECRDN